MNKTFKAAIIEPFAVSADNGQRADSFGETLKLAYAWADFQATVFLQWSESSAAAPIFRLVGTLVFPGIFLSFMCSRCRQYSGGSIEAR